MEKYIIRKPGTRKSNIEKSVTNTEIETIATSEKSPEKHPDSEKRLKLSSSNNSTIGVRWWGLGLKPPPPQIFMKMFDKYEKNGNIQRLSQQCESIVGEI